MFEYGFTLSQASVHCGPVTFVVTNKGTIEHDFLVEGSGANGAGAGPTGGSTAVLDAGQSQTITANFTSAGNYTYVCDLPQHVALGMIGTLSITN
jgi:plastocyanin